MKKTYIVYNGNLNDFKKAIECVTKILVSCTGAYPACISLAEYTPKADSRCVFLDITPKALKRKEEYLIKIQNDDIYISGFDKAGLLYGCVDLYNKYIVPNNLTHRHSYYYKNIFEDTLPNAHICFAPSVSNRGIWTWGHVIYDYRSFIDNMLLCKMNTLIVWDDFVPVNAREMVEYAHQNCIKVIWGFSWLWDTGFSTVTPEIINQSIDGIINKYETEYAHLGGDGIYFQSFTELKEETLNGMLVAEAVTDFVNTTGGRLLDRHPELELEFGLHATSVKQKTEYISKVDKRIRIVWEDCGAFPFDYLAENTDGFEQTKVFAQKAAKLRGEDDRFGVVLKGFISLNWAEFEHQHGGFYLGASSKQMRLKRTKQRRGIWRYVQAHWLSNADKAYEMIKAVAKERAGDLYITALVEDGMFEEKIYYPVALYSEMLWNTESDIKTLQTDVALRSYVDFV